MLKLAEEGVIYARVSSVKQVREGHGISSQIRACQSQDRRREHKCAALARGGESAGVDQKGGKREDGSGAHDHPDAPRAAAE